VFACAIGGSHWMGHENAETPCQSGYLLRLTRRMESEARALAEKRVPCRISF
jgi:hypothetical protein